MLLLERIEVVEPFCYLLQTSRIVFHIFGKAFKVASNVSNLNNNTFKPTHIFFDGGIDVSNLLHSLRGATKRINGSNTFIVVITIQ